MRLLAATAVLCLWAATIGSAAGTSATAGVVGLGSGFSTAGETTGYTSPDNTQCTAGMQTIGHAIYARCALEFDVSNLPAGASVTQATLSLFTSSVPVCAAGACSLRVYGYEGDAGFSIPDLTAGAQIGTMGSGQGLRTLLDVQQHVSDILASGASVPIVGLAFGRDPGNPNEDRTVIGHTASANPPILTIQYSLPYELTVDYVATGSSAGRITSNVNIDCPGDCTINVVAGTNVQLTATPEAGRFDHWEGGPCEGQDETCTFNMPDTATTVIAYFTDTPPPASKPPKTPVPTRTPQPTPPVATTSSPATALPSDEPAGTPTPPPTPPMSATPIPYPTTLVAVPIAPTPTPAPLPPAVNAIGGYFLPWIGPVVIIAVVFGLVIGVRRRRRPY